ncbi:RESPONSIVE TO HIGH LIGHT 41 family protein [Dorcoceras hygrometricum]|uniref:RESPONSIVE TO HIGH LIGHT 41 family protein n=1 Tax=Dorcoceras hygrometricum TaxID=472368 RepID=A0A2Z7BEE7_9LAMI|nr:RESPONSIVE TO HIGH LIGHT 41 family protein [Dorcoceras hygrometricum]
MVKHLATSPHDPLGITDSACKNQSVVVSVQYGPFNPYITIRSATIGKSRVAIDPIAMHTSWRSNSDIASVTSIGYPRMSASGESSTTMHRLLHASGSHPISPPDDPKNHESSTCVTINGSGIQLAVGPQSLRLRNHNFGLAQRIMVRRLATSRHDPLGITDSACKNQLVVVSVQYGPFNPYIPIRSTTIGKSRVVRDPIAMHTSWRSNSDIASVTRKVEVPVVGCMLQPEPAGAACFYFSENLCPYSSYDETECESQQ